jgi:hypothetical protein
MCDPVTASIVAGVTLVASTAVGVVQQNKSAKIQERAIRDQLAVSKDEARAEATSELFDNMRAARREAGRTRAQAGEAGLSLTSGSVEALLMDSAMQSEMKNDRTLANMESRHNSNVAEANSMMSRIQHDNWLTGGLKIAAAGAEAYSGFSKASAGKGP